MKKPILALITITGVLAAGYVQSQTSTNMAPPMEHHGWHHMSPQERMDKLSEELNLSDSQKPQVQAVFQEMRQQMRAAFQQAKTNAETQLQGILTPEQYQKLQSMWQQREQHWGKGGTNTTENSGQ